MTLLSALGLLTRLFIDCKEFINLCYDPYGCPVLWIELYSLEELPPGVRPTGCMHDPRTTHMIVGRVTVTLQDAFKVSQEPFGTFSLPAHPKIEHHCGPWPTVLPEVGLVIFAPHPFGLDPHRSFIGLDIVAG